MEEVAANGPTTAGATGGTDPPSDGVPPPCASSPPGSVAAAAAEELVTLKVTFDKKRYDVTVNLDYTIGQLKKHLEPLIGIPAATQKVMAKGLSQDQQTLRELNVTKSQKIMVVGTTAEDLMKTVLPSFSTQAESSSVTTETSSLSKLEAHKQVLAKYGVPDDVMQGKRGVHEPLPLAPLAGMYNRFGKKVRLTFKLDAGQLWFSTKERTEKLPLVNIKEVVSAPIEGHEEYHILGIRDGPTDKSFRWFYWIPAQYVKAVKSAIFDRLDELF